MSFLFMHIKFYHVVAVSVFSSGTAYIASHAEFFFFLSRCIISFGVWYFIFKIDCGINLKLRTMLSSTTFFFFFFCECHLTGNSNMLGVIWIKFRNWNWAELQCLQVSVFIWFILTLGNSSFGSPLREKKVK